MESTYTKVIAKEIKVTIGKLKGVKLSVTSTCNTLNVSLMEAPFTPITEDKIVRKGYDISEKAFEGYYGVNHYSFKEDGNLTVDAKVLFQLVDEIIQKYHWDKSDVQSDYFHCAFYYRYSVGRWNKPFKVIGTSERYFNPKTNELQHSI